MKVRVLEKSWDNATLHEVGEIIDFTGDVMPDYYELLEPIDEDQSTNDGSPYSNFKQADFNAELAKRGIDYANVRSNKDKENLLLKNDAELEQKFNDLKAEASSLEIEVLGTDTIETLEEKIKAKKGE